MRYLFRRPLSTTSPAPMHYAAKVNDAALALQKDGYLLPEDVERISARAAAVAW